MNGMKWHWLNRGGAGEAISCEVHETKAGGEGERERDEQGRCALARPRRYPASPALLHLSPFDPSHTRARARTHTRTRTRLV